MLNTLADSFSLIICIAICADRRCTWFDQTLLVKLVRIYLQCVFTTSFVEIVRIPANAYRIFNLFLLFLLFDCMSYRYWRVGRICIYKYSIFVTRLKRLDCFQSSGFQLGHKAFYTLKESDIVITRQHHIKRRDVHEILSSQGLLPSSLAFDERRVDSVAPSHKSDEIVEEKAELSVNGGVVVGDVTNDNCNTEVRNKTVFWDGVTF